MLRLRGLFLGVNEMVDEDKEVKKVEDVKVNEDEEFEDDDNEEEDEKEFVKAQQTEEEKPKRGFCR